MATASTERTAPQEGAPLKVQNQVECLPKAKREVRERSAGFLGVRKASLGVRKVTRGNRKCNTLVRNEVGTEGAAFIRS